MKRILAISAVLVLSMVLATGALADAHEARVRAIHASPDAPAVDIWVNGSVAFSNAPFTGITDYAKLEPGSYQIQVSPTGATEPIVIDATLDLTTTAPRHPAKRTYGSCTPHLMPRPLISP